MAKGVTDLKNYTHAGNFTWRQAADNGKATGVMAVAPVEEMLDPEGYDKEITSKPTQTYITVHYDIDYVHEFIHRRIILACGFMRGTKLNKEGLLKFIDKQINYSLTENTRLAEATLAKDAQKMVDSYGGTIEYWMEAVKKAEEDKSNKQAVSNGKTREKVTA